MAAPDPLLDPPRPPALTGPEREAIGERVAAALQAAARGDPAPETSEEAPALRSGVLGARHGVFVTLRAGDELRGCIGVLRPDQPLWVAVGSAARSAATRDPRFPPICPAELAELGVEISVLSSMVELSAPPERIARNLRVGVHGLHLELGGRRGLLLPQVATQFDLDAETFLEWTARKAGLEPGEWRAPEARISVFTVARFSVPPVR